MRAIVILRQSSENCVSQLTLAQKISSLAAAEEMYPWDAEEMEKTEGMGRMAEACRAVPE